MQDKSKEKLTEVGLDEKVVDREMTKYSQPKKLNENESSDVSVYRPQLLTKENEDTFSWLYDTPGLYSKNQVS